MDEKQAVIKLAEIYESIDSSNTLYNTILLLKNTEHTGRTASADALVSAYLRSAQWAAKSDNILTEPEIENLKKLTSILRNAAEHGSGAPSDESADNDARKELITETEKPETIEEVLEDLNSLVGMKNIKDQISTFINLIKVQKERELRKMPVSPTSLHAVFYGPPGTGKTTVARILGRVYKSLEMLSSGHLIETDRAGLVAGYVGQTAMKTDELVKKALDGVLFIDEAYTLVPENSSNDFGREAIDTILKRMEDNRKNLVIVVAGYPDEMKHFIDSNPGLKSRFSRYFYFDHYTPEELLEIFRIFILKAAFTLAPDAETAVFEIFKTAYKLKNKTFGNARFARNLFEKIIERQANRIAGITPLTDEILSTIKEDDIPSIEQLNE
ncbi:MAG: AAA family ATPase [Spirochaetes bacterium]|nr:AAA family ATPase [Spirochaetota bacterium]